MAETVSRSVRIQREFFRWFVEHDEPAPGWAAFLTEVGTVDGVDVTEKELRTAVRLLVADGLLGGPPDPDPRNDLPALLQVERCAAVYDSDIARWGRARRGGVGPAVYNDQRDQRTYATNTTGPVVAHSPVTRSAPVPEVEAA